MATSRVLPLARISPIRLAPIWTACLLLPDLPLTTSPSGRLWKPSASPVPQRQSERMFARSIPSCGLAAYLRYRLLIGPLKLPRNNERGLVGTNVSMLACFFYVPSRAVRWIRFCAPTYILRLKIESKGSSASNTASFCSRPLCLPPTGRDLQPARTEFGSYNVPDFTACCQTSGRQRGPCAKTRNVDRGIARPVRRI